MQIDCTMAAYLCTVNLNTSNMGLFDFLFGSALLNSAKKKSDQGSSIYSTYHSSPDYNSGYDDCCCDEHCEYPKISRRVILQSSRRKTLIIGVYFLLSFSDLSHTVHAVRHTAVPILNTIRDTHPLK